MFDRLVDRHDRAARRFRIRGEIGRRVAIAFDRRHAHAARGRKAHRKNSNARVQVDDLALRPRLIDDVGHQMAQQVTVALEERQHVAPQGHGGAIAEGEAVGHIRVAAHAERGRDAREPVDRGETLDRGRIDRRGGIQMDNAVGRIHVLRQVDLADRLQACRSDRRAQPVERVAGREQELTRHPRVAHVVGAFTKEPEARAAHVQPRAHPIPVFRGRGDADGRRKLQPADAPERVGDDLALDLELPGICDVAVDAAAAQRVAERLTAIRRRRVHVQRVGEHDTPGYAIDARDHAFAGDGARDQDDLSIHPREHPAAGGRAVNRQGDCFTRLQHRYANEIAGSP